MLPQETASPEAEENFGMKLTYFAIVWIVLTVLVGVGMVLLAPVLIGLY